MADGLFDQFKNWYEKRHDYARDWKARTGGQVVATMCTYTAEELLMAAGMLPVDPLRPSHLLCEPLALAQFVDLFFPAHTAL